MFHSAPTDIVLLDMMIEIEYQYPYVEKSRRMKFWDTFLMSSEKQKLKASDILVESMTNCDWKISHKNV